jgi:hypothetical protein
VRCGTDTGSAWIGVSYEDGPTYRQAADVAQAFEGRKFNGMTDSYDDQGTVLVAGGGEGMPEEVRYCCDGVNVSRSFTAAAHLEAQRIIATNSNVKDMVICDGTGTLVMGNLRDPDAEIVVIGGRVNNHPWLDAYQAVHCLALGLMEVLDPLKG